MASNSESCSEAGLYSWKKLVVGQHVEVRSLKDKFSGSWRIATVISCGDLSRSIRFDVPRFDSGPDFVINQVDVTPEVDGLITGNSAYHRGIIRPLPPRVLESQYYFGQCVDMFYQDAWWEGVILGHDDPLSQKWRVFLPDTNVEKEVCVGDLRVTLDWDDVSDEWRRRGKWALIEVSQKLEKNTCFLDIVDRIKDVWKDLREHSGFEKLKEWTSPLRGVWKVLLVKVIQDNIKRVFETLESMEDSDELVEGGFPNQVGTEEVEDLVPSDEAASNSSCIGPITFDSGVNPQALGDRSVLKPGSSSTNMKEKSEKAKKHLNDGVPLHISPLKKHKNDSLCEAYEDRRQRENGVETRSKTKRKSVARGKVQ